MRFLIPLLCIVIMASSVHAGTVGRSPQADALYEKGEHDRRMGRYDEARKAYDEALPLYRDAGNSEGQGNVLHGLGDVENALGRSVEAEEYYRDAADRYESAGLIAKQVESERLAKSISDSGLIKFGLVIVFIYFVDKIRKGFAMRQRDPSKGWSNGDVLTFIGVIVAIVAMVASIYTPELRTWLGLIRHP
jgi:tetratricopeptide (TPR) repeat protein